MILYRDLGLLLLRVLPASIMLIAHGWGKLMGFGTLVERFPDPIGLGSAVSLSLAVFAEVGCSILLIVGFKTRFSAVPLLVTMLVAAFVVHAHDPWAKKEFALLYAIPFLVLILTGPGKFSLDQMMKK